MRRRQPGRLSAKRRLVFSPKREPGLPDKSRWDPGWQPQPSSTPDHAGENRALRPCPPGCNAEPFPGHLQPVSPVTTPRESLSRQLAETRFRKLYADHGREVLAFALRRVDNPEDAADVLAETFLVAWRRSADVPVGPEARLWLYGVARRTIANQRRGELRRARLNERLRAELVDAIGEWAPPDDDSGEAIEALGRLDPRDRELLRLTAWEGLGPGQAATVLGLSAVAARSRLHRARRRLRRELERSGAEPRRQGSPNPRSDDEAR